MRTLRYFLLLTISKGCRKQVTSEIAHNKLEKLIVPGDEKNQPALNLIVVGESGFQEKSNKH